MCIWQVTTVGNWGLILLEHWAFFMQNTPPTPLCYLSLGKEGDINPPVPAVIVWGLFLTDIRYLARHKHRLSGLRPPGKVSRKSGGETPRLRSKG